MVHRRFGMPKSMVFLPSLLALAFIIACEGTPATSAPEAKGAAPTPTLVTEGVGPRCGNGYPSR